MSTENEKSGEPSDVDILAAAKRYREACARWDASNTERARHEGEIARLTKELQGMQAERADAWNELGRVLRGGKAPLF